MNVRLEFNIKLWDIGIGVYFEPGFEIGFYLGPISLYIEVKP